MQEIERKNTAVVKAEFSSIVENVRLTKQPLIIQKNNKDVAAIVPLETLNGLRTRTQKRSR